MTKTLVPRSVKRKGPVFKDNPHGKSVPPVYNLPYRRHDLAPLPTGGHLQLVSSGRCKWINGVPGWGTWEMCGHPTHSREASWCPYHLALVYQDKSVVAKQLARIEREKGVKFKAALKEVA